ncbi:MAG: glycoside hydrolase family 3 C-terminal domain-containing protein [Anaerolineaceae bacterium]|nr:glycoside hydrolase family 3 C-terminal domain-containing protein [Anaerolineaceae bacterium]
MKDIRNLIAQMTVEEKASLCSGKDFWHLKGIERLHIPEMMVTDGPHGLRKQAGRSDHLGLLDTVPAVCFPTASSLAATWDRDLIYQVGAALGEECRAEEVAVILGPGANIKRSPLCGRNFEYFSEDPYLSGQMAKSHINGVQSQGIGTSLKHFAVNNQEYRRMTIDAVVDERALREIYLAGFEMAVKKAQPWTVMCAYNKVNGTYCAENPFLMTQVLKEEWGHEGLVVTDWGAMNERVEGLRAGVELEMPGAPNGNDQKIVAAVQSGELDEAILDRAVERILTMIFKAEDTLAETFAYDREAHHALARKVAGKGAVLLKNEDAALPVAEGAVIALVGRFAKVPRYQGGGSSLMEPTRLDTLYDEMLALVGKDRLRYAPGYDAKSDLPDDVLIEEALKVSKGADVVVVCAGLPDLYETEGLDRTHMHMPPAHNALIQQLADAHERVVVVLSNGSPVEMPWVNEVQAVLEGYLGGQAGAGGIADILLGRVNPGGKLAETFPLKLEDNPSYPHFPGGPAVVEYRESLYVGYRYYDTVQQEVLFPFGHGLSYTRFAYRDLAVQPGSGENAFVVTLKVKNTGAVAGDEIVQLYVRDVEASVFRPEKELKGFARVSLQPGEETVVMLELDSRAFAFYDTMRHDWIVEAGTFEILVGASSRDIRLKTMIEAGSETAGGQQHPVYRHFPKGAVIDKAEFEALLGRPVPPNEIEKKGSYTLNTPLYDLRGSAVGRRLYKMIQKQAAGMIVGQEDTSTALMMQSMIKDMPLRNLLMMSGGRLNANVLEGMLLLMNAKFLKGMLVLFRSRKR